jgi:hypothetical protein
VIVSVLTLLSNRSVDPLHTLHLIIFGMLPVSHVLFASMVGRMKPEA